MALGRLCPLHAARSSPAQPRRWSGPLRPQPTWARELGATGERADKWGICAAGQFARPGQSGGPCEKDHEA